MKIRLTLTLRIERKPKLEPRPDPIPPHDVVEGGAYIESRPHPTYIGFQREDEREIPQ